MSLGCAVEDNGGECGTDQDCSGDQVCLLDIKTSTLSGETVQVPENYCVEPCSGPQSSECPATQTCRESRSLPGISIAAQALCVDRTRICRGTDPLNGLDDDCDGTIDGPGPSAPVRCSQDADCGAFACRAPEGASVPQCGAPEEDALPNFRPCSNGQECRNGTCQAGICSPICRPEADLRPESRVCQSLLVEGRLRETSCARNVGPGDRPPHNVCQIGGFVDGSPSQFGCESGDCPSGTACVWRDVVGPDTGRHFFVCSRLDPDRARLGSACPANTVEEDLKCQHGLCFDQRCTRKCAGPQLDDCADMGPGFGCRREILTYGGNTNFDVFVCVRLNP